MAPGALDALTKELVYIAVSAASTCSYCLHTHAPAARSKGMSEPMFNELTQVVARAQTNRIAIALQVPTDACYLMPSAAWFTRIGEATHAATDQGRNRLPECAATSTRGPHRRAQGRAPIARGRSGSARR